MKIKSDILNDSGQILIESQRETRKYFTSINDRLFVVHPGVFSPKYFLDAKFFAEVLPDVAGEEFMEMGCGSGYIAVLAALGGASRVTATDLNLLAVENTRENARIHEVSDCVEVVGGDLFEAIPRNRKFNTIFWNIPFGKSQRDNLSILERSIYDPNYSTLKRFIEDSRSHLTSRGRLLLGFSDTIGDYESFRRILAQNNFEMRLIGEKIDYQGNHDATQGRYREVNYQLFECK